MIIHVEKDTKSSVDIEHRKTGNEFSKRNRALSIDLYDKVMDRSAN
jgi:hypothetical protein